MPDPEYLVLGRALAALRRRAGLTQAQVADAVGISNTFVSQVERGHRGLSWRTLTRVLAVYGVTLRGLVDEIERGEGKGRSGIASRSASGIVPGISQRDDAKGVDMPAATATQGSEKVREIRLRRMAERQGLKLARSRRRDPRAIDYGRYMIVDTFTNTVVAGELNTPGALDLDEVEAYLKGER
jgi:transcriptional regulator with XRE-family HTH domain